MAVLYMLHIETSLDVSRKEVDTGQREKLKRFSKWVPCQCRQPCGREWNFVNEIGLSRGGDDHTKCDFPGLIKKKGHWTVAFKTDQAKRLKTTRDMWLAAV
jgi:calcium-independent phospholipase A2-gamma